MRAFLRRAFLVDELSWEEQRQFRASLGPGTFFFLLALAFIVVALTTPVPVP